MRHPRLQVGRTRGPLADVSMQPHSCCAVCSRGPNGIWTLQHAGKPIPKCKTTFATAKPSYTHQVRAHVGSRACNSLQALQLTEMWS